MSLLKVNTYLKTLGTLNPNENSLKCATNLGCGVSNSVVKKNSNLNRDNGWDIWSTFENEI
jgi:hypothetical protein